MEASQPDSSELWDQTRELSRSSQLTLLRIVCWVAWSDGDIAGQERGMLHRIAAELFPGQVESLEQDGTLDAVAESALLTPRLESLVDTLPSQADRQLAVKLVYQMMSAHHGCGQEGPISPAERHAYQRLLEVLDLPPALVEEAEQTAHQHLRQHPRPSTPQD